MKPENTVDFHIRWAWAKIARYYNVAASPFGGSMSIGYVLLNVDKEGTPSTKLGPKMGMESRSLTRILNNLEKEGLLTRIQDEADKRKMNVFLTEKGIQMREESKKVVLNFNLMMEEALGKKELEQFLQTMEKLNKHIDNQLVELQSEKN
ncbi:MAG: MarR family winged helix-turn-helix transcriptional regulator [Flavobacteriales bacterium]